MNVDLSRQEVELIVKSLRDNPDIVTTILVKKLESHFPPQVAGTGTLEVEGAAEVARKYQQFGT